MRGTMAHIIQTVLLLKYDPHLVSMNVYKDIKQKRPDRKKNYFSKWPKLSEM